MSQIISQSLEDVANVFGDLAYSLGSALLHRHSQKINHSHQQTQQIIIDQLSYHIDRCSHKVFHLFLILKLCLVQNIVDDFESFLTISMVSR